MRLSLSIIVIFLIAVSCSRSADNKIFEGLSKIEIDEQSEDDIILSDYVDEITYVKLDSSAEAFVSSVNQVRFRDGKAFIFDKKRQRISAFQMDGKFLFKVASQGQGPGEYGEIDFFDYNIVSETIDIYDIRLGKIMKYDHNGDFTKEIKVRLIARDFITTSEGDYVFYSPDEANEIEGQQDLAGMIHVDKSGEHKKVIGAYGDPTYYPYIASNALIHDGNDILLVSNYSDTVYNLSNTGLEANNLLDYKTKLPKGMLYKKHRGKWDFPFWKVSPLSTEAFLGYIFILNEKAKYMLYNKRTNETLVSSNVINDLDGGFPLITDAVQIDNEHIGMVLSQRNIDQLNYHMTNNRKYLRGRGVDFDNLMSAGNIENIKNHIVANDGNAILAIGKLKSN